MQEILIYEPHLEQINNISGDCCILLYGIWREDSSAIVTLCQKQDLGDILNVLNEEAKEIHMSEHLIWISPIGIELLGIILPNDSQMDPIKENVAKLGKNSFFIIKRIQKGEKACFEAITCLNKEWTEAKYTTYSPISDFLSDYFFTKIDYHVNLTFSISDKPPKLLSNFDYKLENLLLKVKRLKKKFLLSDLATEKLNELPKLVLREFREYKKEEIPLADKLNNFHSWFILKCTLYSKQTIPEEEESKKEITKCLKLGLEHGKVDCFDLTIPIYILCSNREFNITQIMKSSIDKALLIFTKIREIYLQYKKSFNFYSFVSDTLLTPIVLPYPILEDNNQILRTKYHKLFLLPDEIPILRSYQSIEYKKTIHKNKLRTIHGKLLQKKNFDEESKKWSIKGSYVYFHYLQDGINDNGWGCAYRSLQTLFSWFILQGYSNKPIPTIVGIQEALVLMNDKEQDFIGSKQWIGAFEVMFNLNYFLDVECKIINMNSGGEFGSHTAELQDHFEREGTPIMIGGGQYAYTLLGLDVEAETGETLYLILDPHYTGQDLNLKNIISKGWCQWKNKDLFKLENFYNLCLPQKPRLI